MRVIKCDFYQDLQINRFECRYCSTKFSREDSLKRHMLARCKIQKIPSSQIDQYMEENHSKGSKEHYKIR